MGQSALQQPASDALALALAEATDTFAQRNSASAEQFERASLSMPGGNTRTVLFYKPFPVTMVRGEGCTLWDMDGHRYDDFLGEYTAGLYGHSDECILQAIKKAMDDGLSLSGHNRLESELAAEICNRIPSIDLVRFTNSGTEANLMAIALAKVATGRSKILVFDGAYHGSAISFFGGVSSPINVPHDFIICPYNDPEAATALVRKHGPDLAAVLVEPMLGAGGCIPGDVEFLGALRHATDAVGALLIFDEVMTSRLAFGGRQSQLKILPDITVIGKYFGGGLSFGAYGGRPDLLERFDPRRPSSLSHPGTFNNNTLTMAAGLAGLRERLDREAVSRFNDRGGGLRDDLNAILRKAEFPMSLTGLGSVMNVHGTKAEIRNAGDLRGQNERLKELFFFDMLEEGIYLARRGLIALSLPIGDAETERLKSAVTRFVERRRPLLAQLNS
ncbi:MULTISPECIES: aspartate aminotransferase family protein [unclassified Bradyrhizobium]|uniref:aspartate aminotransferase family protein n=1 Tax=unclassified Bradyrhizobium TaxID=2631580 RepID=UPI0028E5732E|nr:MULTISPECIES: aminotransferase class III-fold pyridoxal phosphate-dependent enzyme [unclassified Bradyrhizobium]